MINIARLIPIYSRQYGGPAVHINELTKFLKPFPIRNIIYTTNALDFKETKKAPKIHEVSPKLIIKRFNSYLRFREYRVSFGLFKELLKDSKNIDIFHSHAPRSYQEDMGSLVALIKNKKKLVITSHGGITLSLNYFQHLYQRIIDLSLGNIKNTFLDINYIVVTKFEAEYLIRFGIAKENIYLIPHGIDINHFKHSNSSNFIKLYNLEKKKIVLYVGRLFKDKRIDILINAFSLLKKEISDTVLLLAGGDFGYKSTLENLIQKMNLKHDVIILGHLPKRYLPEIYSMADVVVMPAKSETFGLVALEANACKTPVIASNHWGPREIINNGKNGFLIEFGDIIEMKEKLILILSNEELKKKMGDYAREYVKSNFSWEINAKKHYELYKKILEK